MLSFSPCTSRVEGRISYFYGTFVTTLRTSLRCKLLTDRVQLPNARSTHLVMGLT